MPKETTVKFLRKGDADTAQRELGISWRIVGIFHGMLVFMALLRNLSVEDVLLIVNHS
jgi:hypothetical protein